MPTKLEQAAKAAFERRSAGWKTWDEATEGMRTEWIADMRAAMVVLREPDEAMLHAGSDEDEVKDDGYGGLFLPCKKMWQAMIDAVEGGQEGE